MSKKKSTLSKPKTKTLVVVVSAVLIVFFLLRNALATTIFDDSQLTDCAKRAALKTLPKTVAYVKYDGAYQPETMIREVFYKKGYTVSSHRKSTFVVAKHDGKSFNWDICNTTQTFNHIPGEHFMTKKELLYDHYTTYANRIGLADNHRALKKTWQLNKPGDCLELRAIANKFTDEELSVQALKWIVKPFQGGHNGFGIKLLSNADLVHMFHQYTNPDVCDHQKALVQEFIPNQLLLTNKTFNFRIFMFVANLDPFLAFYFNGYVRLSRVPYNPDSMSPLGKVSNSRVDYSKGKLTFWLLPYLQEYMTEQKLAGPRWVKDVLIPGMKYYFVQVLNATRHKFSKNNKFYGVFGADFTLDTSLRLWLFEVNFSPEMSNKIYLPKNNALLRNLWGEVIAIENELQGWRRQGTIKDLAAHKLQSTTYMQPLIDEGANWTYSISDDTLRALHLMD
eukprot:TRINITY_DN7853_c0_g1_i1.p1 TRINITY_DN7853_c0_g1~~TRINITY_DN7853_c0_g1_i1.p1  ORF type:complete len:450 (+),score=28.76 TRINITY_DN7853_c0_g1_i1:53-1402(+)